MAQASVAKASEIPLSKIHRCGGVQLIPVIAQPGPVPSRPCADAPLREDSQSRGWLEVLPSVNPSLSGGQPLILPAIPRPRHPARPSSAAALATEGGLVCLLLVQTVTPTAAHQPSERRNAMTSSTLRPEYISLQDGAALYSVSVDLLRERIRTGELPAVHAGRRLIRVRLDDLRRMFRPLPAARRYRQTA